MFNPKSKAGFTVIELLIAIAMIAILAAISIVAYNDTYIETQYKPIQTIDLRSFKPSSSWITLASSP